MNRFEKKVEPVQLEKKTTPTKEGAQKARMAVQKSTTKDAGLLFDKSDDAENKS